MFQLFNISKKRSMPLFADETFMEWFQERASSTGKQKVALFIDIFTNYHEPKIGKAAVRFLESQGFNVVIPDLHEIGRPQLSKGMLTHAKSTLDKALPKLTAFTNQDIPIIGLEPSEILTLRDEYLDLCSDDQLERAQKVADNSFTFPEFTAHILNNNGLSPEAGRGDIVYVHGHCHAKALIGQSNLETVLSAAGYNPKILDTGCGGMAGSFGYEADHYELSIDMGSQRLFPAVNNTEENALICAPGFSCRHQIKHGTGREAYHPAELLANIV